MTQTDKKKHLLPQCDLNVLEAAEISVKRPRANLTQAGIEQVQADWLRQHAQEARRADIGLAREQMAAHQPKPALNAAAPAPDVSGRHAPKEPDKAPSARLPAAGVAVLHAKIKN